ATSSLSITASRTTGSGILSGTTVVSAVNGVATFTDLAITGSGTTALTFSGTGVSSVTSATFDVATAGFPPTALAITTQPSTSAQSGVAFPTQPVVKILDAAGNPVAVSGVEITTTISSGTGNLIGGFITLTNAGGTANFSGVGINGASGPYTLSFSSPSLTSATSNTIALGAGAA